MEGMVPKVAAYHLDGHPQTGVRHGLKGVAKVSKGETVWYSLPYANVSFEECLWDVLWSDGTQACIRSCGGTEVRVEKIESITPPSNYPGRNGGETDKRQLRWLPHVRCA